MDDVDDSLDDGDDIVSYEVMTEELKECEKRLKQLGKSPEAQDEEFKRDDLKIKMQIFEDQIDCGVLTQDAYVAKLKAAIMAEQKKNEAFKQKGNKEGMIRCAKRVKIMTDELKMAQ